MSSSTFWTTDAILTPASFNPLKSYSLGHIQSGGSIFLSTAFKVNFLDGSEFISDDPSSILNLSSSMPIGFEFQNNLASITIQGNGHTLINPIFTPIFGSNLSTSKISLGEGNTISLSSGNILFNGGILVQRNGDINLASINTGTLAFSNAQNKFKFDTNLIKIYGDIELKNNALVQSIGAGDINITSKNININSGSGIFINNDFSAPSLGNININAVESISLDGTLSSPQFASAIRTDNNTNNSGGNITVTSNNLNITNGGQFVARVFGNSRAGSLNIESNDVFIDGYLASSPNIFSNISSATFGNGAADNISLQGNNLTISNGGDLGSATFGLGNGGNVNIVVNNNIHISGVVPEFFTPSVINAATFGPGNAGSVDIKTKNLLVDSGGRISTSTVSSGSAGRLNIQASNDIKVIGTVPGSITPSSIDSSASEVDPRLAQQLQLVSGPTGQSGTLAISSHSLEISNGAQVTTRNDGPGDAGLLTITASQATLRNSNIFASTQGGNGGDIQLNISSILLADSKITASAKIFGNGGNINISSTLLAGDSKSFIVANAEQGLGGNIKINTKGLIFPQSNITATSDKGSQFSGNVKINFTTTTFNEKNELVQSQNLANVPISCSNGRNRLRVVTADALNVPDDRLEAFARANGIPMSVDATGKKTPWLRVQGWIPSGNGMHQTVAVVGNPSYPSAIASGCGATTAIDRTE